MKANVIITEVVPVVLITKRIDWGTGKYIEEKIDLIVDQDQAHKMKKVKIRNFSEVPRNSKLHNKRPSYILEIHYAEAYNVGITSLGNFLYDVPSGTRRIKGCAANDFSRKAFGLC